MHACTIVASNYLAHARVLANSFLANHADGCFTVLLLDGEAGPSQESFRLLDVYSIGIESVEVHRMAAIYDVTEFATAVKPFLLRMLLSDEESVVYLDPDIEVLAPLDDIFELAGEHGVVLTPHSLEPLPRDGQEPSETTILRAGVYNLGFIAVGRSAHPFLDWWAERLRRECLIAPASGRFVDQRWVDFVPSLFPHHILRDPGCNVAWWNLTNRHVEHGPTGYTVDGDPIRFFHFSGFSPGTPDLLSKYLLPVPRLSVRDQPALGDILRDYRSKLLDAGYKGMASTRYGWDMTAGGLRLDRPLRQAYRMSLVHAEAEGRSLPPDPFDDAQVNAFAEWRQMLPPGAGVPALERAEQLLAHGPGGGFIGDSPGVLTTAARRLARRLVWPFLDREQSLHRTYVEALEEHASRLARLEAQLAATDQVDNLTSVATPKTRV